MEGVGHLSQVLQSPNLASDPARLGLEQVGSMPIKVRVSCRTATDTLLTAPGLALLGTAVTEAQYPGKDNQAFARQLYVHALGYLLQGLPQNLSEAEAKSLQASIPPSLQIDDTRRDGQPSPRTTAGPPPPSLLHRLLASGIVHLFVFFSFIVPYIKLVLRGAYRYERTHRVSERVFAAGLDLMDQVGQTGFGIAGIVMQIGNGKVGSLMAGTCAWWIEGISGGIHDGVGEGMARMGARETTVTRLRGRCGT